MLATSRVVNKASSWLAAGSQDAVDHGQTQEALPGSQQRSTLPLSSPTCAAREPGGPGGRTLARQRAEGRVG